MMRHAIEIVNVKKDEEFVPADIAQIGAALANVKIVKHPTYVLHFENGLTLTIAKQGRNRPNRFSVHIESKYRELQAALVPGAILTWNDGPAIAFGVAQKKLLGRKAWGFLEPEWVIRDLAPDELRRVINAANRHETPQPALGNLATSSAARPEDGRKRSGENPSPQWAG